MRAETQMNGGNCARDSEGNTEAHEGCGFTNCQIERDLLSQIAMELPRLQGILDARPCFAAPLRKNDFPSSIREDLLLAIQLEGGSLKVTTQFELQAVVHPPRA